MYADVRAQLTAELDRIRADGLEKAERVLTGPQGPRVTVGSGAEVLNLCANDYLGMAGDPRVAAAAKDAIDRWGYGLSSVRFICGTQEPHRVLERRLSAFLGTDDTILYSSCFDANGGLFATLLSEDDAVISDALNHASIIDGIRLCPARRLRYRNRDLDDLEDRLRSCRDARRRLIVTDGVFSMDGHLAPLDAICALADAYDALVMVDDSHATGVLGPTGRGTPELYGVADRVDILTGTLGKALGGASGGYTSGRAEIIALLRQRSRPYLFSNTVPPAVAGASLAVLDLLEADAGPRTRLRDNAAWFRARMTALGFDLPPGEHPIIPVMIGDAARATRVADALLDHGVYVVGFCHPVVPRGAARIRTQMSAAHTRADLERAVSAFTAVGRVTGLIPAGPAGPAPDSGRPG